MNMKRKYDKKGLATSPGEEHSIYRNMPLRHPKMRSNSRQMTISDEVDMENERKGDR